MFQTQDYFRLIGETGVSSSSSSSLCLWSGLPSCWTSATETGALLHQLFYQGYGFTSSSSTDHNLWSASAVLSLQKLWSVDTVLWLCPSQLMQPKNGSHRCPFLMQESFWWGQCSDRCIISLFPRPPYRFSPFSSSLISRMVSVDVKYHVYLLTSFSSM